MRTLSVLLLVLLLAGVAQPCSNTEADESTQIQYTNVVVCSGHYCGMNSIKTWEYECVSDAGSDCIPADNVIIQENKTWWCNGSQCQLGTLQFFGDGKTTRICP